MAEDDTSLYLLVIVSVLAVVGLGLAAASFATNQSMNRMMNGGGMMGPPATNTTQTAASAPGLLEWTILILSAAFFLVSVVLIVRSRQPRPRAEILSAVSAPPSLVPAPGPAPEPSMQSKVGPAVPGSLAAPSALSASRPVPEPTLIKLLDADEKRMYLELRDHGGQMFQRDLVALGIFSKAKVTRVLDKLEAKGLLVREAHGMTNRVRLVNQPAR